MFSLFLWLLFICFFFLVHRFICLSKIRNRSVSDKEITLIFCYNFVAIWMNWCPWILIYLCRYVCDNRQSVKSIDTYGLRCHDVFVYNKLLFYRKVFNRIILRLYDDTSVWTARTNTIYTDIEAICVRYKPFRLRLNDQQRKEHMEQNDIVLI